MNKKMSLVSLVVGALLLVSAVAVAAPRGADLAVSASAPAAVNVGDSDQVSFTVSNQGNRGARGVTLEVLLPATGALLGAPGSCSQAGQLLTCTTGRLNPGESQTWALTWDFGGSPGQADFEASVSNDRGGDTDLGNNEALVEVDVQATHPAAIADGDVYHGAVCYGSAPLVFQDCLDAPSSILTAQLGFHGDGSINTGDPGYEGDWSQNSPADLSMQFFLLPGQDLVSSWSGVGINDDCFEGTVAVNGTIITHGAFRLCKSAFPW